MLKDYMGIKFSQSPKIREPLNMLEMNDIHLLNWGSPRMAGFLDVCMQASNISKSFNSFVHFIFPDEVLK